MRFPRNAKIFRGQLDAAPFAGVFFLLALLLLMTSRLAFTPSVRIDLPVIGRDLPGIANSIAVVALDADGQMYFQNQVMTEPELLQRLRQAVQQSREPLTLVIQADGRARLESVEPLLAAAPELGFKDVSFLTRGTANINHTSPRPPRIQ
jgi:biopolymer transport protein ExbD